MAYYVQRMCLDSRAVIIQPGDNIPFDTQGVCSTMRDEMVLDFEYDVDTRLIDFRRLGRYIVLWVVRQQTGLPGSGHTFQLFKEDDKSLDTSLNPPRQASIFLSSESTQLKTANSIGVGIVDKSYNFDIVKLGLKNVSKDVVTIAPDSDIKAQILIYGAADIDGELTMINKRLTHLIEATKEGAEALEAHLREVVDELDNTITNTQAGQSIDIADLDVRLRKLAADLIFDTTPSEIFEQEYDPLTLTGIPGCTMQSMYVENNFHFWVTGTITDENWSSFAEHCDIYIYDVEDEEWIPTGEQEYRIYLWRSDADHGTERNPWRALTWYLGDYTVAPAWKNKVSSSLSQQLVPVYQHGGGIYLLLDDVMDMEIGDYLDFTIALLLLEQ